MTTGEDRISTRWRLCVPLTAVLLLAAACSGGASQGQPSQPTEGSVPGSTELVLATSSSTTPDDVATINSIPVDGTIGSASTVPTVTSSPDWSENPPDVSWHGFPLFAYPRSAHSFAFELDEPAEGVALDDASTVDTVAAVYNDATERWEAHLIAPDSGPWTISVIATRAGDTTRTTPVQVPIVPTHSDDEPVTFTDIPSTTLALIEWGDGPAQVGLETPYEGETQTPSGIIWVQDTDELVIVDRVNERLLVTDAVGAPIRTIPLPVKGWLTDGVMLPDRRMLVAEVRRRGTQVFTVAHIVDLASGAVEPTEAVEIPIAPDTASLRFDPPSGLVYAQFGELYPYYDTRTGSIVSTDIAANGWAGLVTDDAQAGITSGPDYLAATFPLQPTITDTEATSTDVWATVVAADWDLADQDGTEPPLYNWLTRFPFDGSPITASPAPAPNMWTADNVFAVRKHDILLMVATDDGLELNSFPIRS